MPDDNASTPPPKVTRRSKQIGLRIDEDLHVAAMEKSRPYGGLSAVIRAMLRTFVRGERNFDIEDLTEENTPAEKPRPARRRKPSPSSRS